MKQIVGVTVTPRTVAHWLMKGVKLPLFLLVLLTLILVAGRRAYAQDVQYAAAIKDAAVYQQSHVHELVPPRFPVDTRGLTLDIPTTGDMARTYSARRNMVSFRQACVTRVEAI